MQHYEQTFIKKSSEKWSEGQFCVVKGTVDDSRLVSHGQSPAVTPRQARRYPRYRRLPASLLARTLAETQADCRASLDTRLGAPSMSRQPQPSAGAVSVDPVGGGSVCAVAGPGA